LQKIPARTGFAKGVYAAQKGGFCPGYGRIGRFSMETTNARGALQCEAIPGVRGRQPLRFPS